MPDAVTAKRPVKTLTGTVTPMNNDARKKTLALYEKAVKLLHGGSYDKAHVLFNEMLQTASPEFGDRIRMYIATCVAQLSQGTTEFRSHEERYDYAILLLNKGHYEDARKHLSQIALENNSADYAFYGLALLASMTGDHSDCIEHLTEAIRLNAHNRLLARSDSDFSGIADNPSFTDLLYPEA